MWKVEAKEFPVLNNSLEARMKMGAGNLRSPFNSFGLRTVFVIRTYYLTLFSTNQVGAAEVNKVPLKYCLRLVC
ncbi:unnamed protein product [Orchesella dallaii]|uniref:Uncharacterized protein n=1 Tax=Orchesella dallaii TaxID=48710 RepID=A0ABP1PNZ6_9HEXA